jgi:hypothetical protein
MAGANNTWIADIPVDGEYEEWVRPDTYAVTMSLKPPGGEAGYRSQTKTVVTTWSSEISGQDFYLEESGIPIPEFPAGLFAAAAAIASAIILLRRSACVRNWRLLKEFLRC